MARKLEILLTVDETLKGINLFAVDDYLRSIQTSEGRKKLIVRYGYSPERRAAYERRHQLPRGAFELAMLVEDRRYQELTKSFVEQMSGLGRDAVEPIELEKVYQEAYSTSVGLQHLYPEATDFLLQYSLLNSRNQRHFLGDYRFSSEYRLQYANSWCPTLTPVNCNIFVNLGILLNVIAGVFIAAAVCFFGWAGPLFLVPITSPFYNFTAHANQSPYSFYHHHASMHHGSEQTAS